MLLAMLLDVRNVKELCMSKKTACELLMYGLGNVLPLIKIPKGTELSGASSSATALGAGKGPKKRPGKALTAPKKAAVNFQADSSDEEVLLPTCSERDVGSRLFHRFPRGTASSTLRSPPPTLMRTWVA